MSPTDHSSEFFRNLFISRTRSSHFWSPSRHQFHCSPPLRFGPSDPATVIYRGVIPFPVSLYSHLIHHHRSSPFAFSTFTFSVSFLCSCSSYFSCFTARNVHYNVLLNLQLSPVACSFPLGFPYCKESTALFHSIICLPSLTFPSSSFGKPHCCGTTVWMHRGAVCH